ncbi:MAG: mechanosensitive ion channel [bacterium]|nr:mechanosensitive ion channel [bacterium]
MKKMRPTLLILSAIVFCLFTFPAFSQDVELPQGETWLPEELNELELQFQEVSAQVETLDKYAPDAEDFKNMERINQLVEQLDFNKRKFDLLINLYNIVEDKIFPGLKKLLAEKPELGGQIYNKIKEYTGKSAKSILKVQEQINDVALQIERLDKRIERTQLTSRKKEMADDMKSKTQELKQQVGLSVKINLLEEEQAIYKAEIPVEEERLKELKAKEKEKSDKIKEKRKEIYSFKKEKSKNRVDRLINKTFTKVRVIRLNGLEIPRLNTLKTFVYLVGNTIATLQEKIENIDREISSLRAQEREELIDKGIRGLLVVAIVLLLVFIVIKSSVRISNRIISRVDSSQKLDAHRKQRYQTLSTVLLSGIRIFVWIMAVLLVMAELNVDYGPFLVAAGGLSLAIGFGAQSLVKDVVTGFFLLMEEQFALGDSIEINGKSGTVEKISLRTIKFRGLDGTLHIIPNGNISNVSNKTYQWSRAVVGVGVSYDDNPEKVLELLNGICEDIHKDPKWKDIILEAPSAQGILSLGDSAVNFRILAKTTAGDHWPLGRELNLRIKKVFDENGIDIPYNYFNIVDKTPKPEKKEA